MTKKKNLKIDAKTELGRMKKLGSDFKKFISRGNVVDMAVGVVVGGAFSKIVTSLVNDVITPAIGVLLGGLDFSELSFGLKDAREKTIDNSLCNGLRYITLQRSK